MRLLKMKSYVPAYGIGIYFSPNTAIALHIGKKIYEIQFAHKEWKRRRLLKDDTKMVVGTD